MLAAGVDPAQEKRGRKALEDDRGDIFRVVAEEYVSKLKHEGRTAATITKIEWLLAFPHPALGDQAMAAFSRLREISGGGGLPFPGVRTPTRPISDNTLNAALRRLGYGTDDVTAHGFRATASSLVNECGKWHPDAIERHRKQEVTHQRGGSIARNPRFSYGFHQPP